MREYSIPSVKKSGRISIPENSFEKIRYARDLHRQGLGTESVRTRLSGAVETAPDTGEIALKLERLSRDLEGLRGDPKALEEASSTHALRTVLARQSLLMSAVFNLTEMVETLLRSTGQPRRVEEDANFRRPEGIEVGGSGTRLARSSPGKLSIRLSGTPDVVRSERGSSDRGFGSLARRRRRGAVVAAGLLVILLLALVIFAISRGGGSSSEPAENNAALTTVAREEIRVPDLSGLTYREAERRLDRAGLVLEERDSREGEVVGQTPDAGAEASDGDSVSVTLGGDGSEATGAEDTGSPGAAQYGEDVFEYTE